MDGDSLTKKANASWRMHVMPLLFVIMAILPSSKGLVNSFKVGLGRFQIIHAQSRNSILRPSFLSQTKTFAAKKQTQSSIIEKENIVSGNVTILQQEEHFLVVSKPPSVVCHHSEWTGSRSSKKDAVPEIPMIQRVREAIGGRRVNLVHRLDRGASGCLLMTYTDETLSEKDDNSLEDSIEKNMSGFSSDVETAIANSSATTKLIHAMASTEESTKKTYIALVRGEGILHGRDFKKEGWFLVDRPIKNENGVLKNATTWFRFIAGQGSFKDDGSKEIDPNKPRASLILARPVTGRWHQIRRHCNGLSHPILGDSSHGNSRTNQEWRKRGMLLERTCLHLAQLKIGPIPDVCPEGIFVSCDLAPDMMQLLEEQLPDVLQQAEPILLEEGIRLRGNGDQHGMIGGVREVPFTIAF